MIDKTRPGDEELLDRIKSGDGAAFEALYDRRHAGVYRYALRMCGSVGMAEDITQDVFIELIRDAVRFDPSKGTVAGYLFGITRHRVLRKLQRERALIPTQFDEQIELEVSNQDKRHSVSNPLQELAKREMVDCVRQAVLALPLHYREVVVLCNLEEMNYEQAAKIIGCPVGTVRSRLNRARAMLVDKLKSYQQAEVIDRKAESAR